MMGWPVVWKCRVACLFFEESQQPTCPQIRHRRRCTHVSPIFKQSSQPLALGVTSLILSRCVHFILTSANWPKNSRQSSHSKPPETNLLPVSRPFVIVFVAVPPLLLRS